MCESSTTTKTELPEPTPEELKAMAQNDAALEAYLELNGYSMTSNEVSKFDNPEKVESLEITVANLRDRRGAIEGKLKVTQGYNEKIQLQGELQEIDKQLNKTVTDLANEQEKVTIDYDYKIEKKTDPRVQELMDKGKTAEADALKEELKQKDLALLDQKDTITKQWADAVQKYLSGDLSITDYQKAELEASTSRIKEPVLAVLKDLDAQIAKTEAAGRTGMQGELAEIDRTYQGISDQLDQVVFKIKETGLSTSAALMESEARAKQGGMDMMGGLDETLKTSRVLSENGLLKQTRDLRRLTAEKAVALGRPSTDPAFLRDLDTSLSEAVKDVELNLAVMGAQGKLGIMEKVNTQLMDIQQQRVALAKEQGRRLEDVAVTKTGIVEQTGLRREGVAQRGTALGIDTGLRLEDVSKARVNLAETLATRQEEQRLALAQGLPVSGSALAGQWTAGQQQGQAVEAGALSGVQSAYSAEMNRQAGLRMAQPTTTVTQSPSIIGSLFSGIGVLAGGAGSVMTGIGDLRG